MWKKTLKATCSSHPRCTLLAEAWWFDHTDRILLGWLAQGRYTTAAQHGAEAERIRASKMSGAASSSAVAGKG